MSSLDRTPTSNNKKSLRCKRPDGGDTADASSQGSSAVPTTSNKIQADSEDSPVYFPTTQESSEDIDVVWDWNSPRRGDKTNKKKKRLLPMQSPKLPIKRHPSNNRIQCFDKLKEELKSLQAELSHVEDESVLCLSPLQEEEFKDPLSVYDNALEDYAKEEHMLDVMADFFNDSADEDLLELTQKIEREIPQKVQIPEQNSRTQIPEKNSNDSIEIDKIVNKYTATTATRSNVSCGGLDDSFDLVLSQLPNDAIESTVKRSLFDKAGGSHNKNQLLVGRSTATSWASNSSSNNNKPQRTTSEYDLSTTYNKFEFNRTRSFEMQMTRHNGTALPKSTIEEEIERKRLEAIHRLENKRKLELEAEIERRRLEAKAKLESKKSLQHSVVTAQGPAITKTDFGRVSNQCTAEEIEKKRLQAIAKLKTSPLKIPTKETPGSNSKVKETFEPTPIVQQEIERKRREALMKLNMKNNKPEEAKTTSDVYPGKFEAANRNLSESKTAVTMPTNGSSAQIAEDIERKRQEALAKLKLKQKQEPTTTTCDLLNRQALIHPQKIGTNSQIVPKNNLFSVNSRTTSHGSGVLEEVEKKRREALAKLEAKKMQDIVEKNRLEALKRLQQTKAARFAVKSTVNNLL